MELDTQRLKLRMFTEDDLDAYAAICADEEVMRFVGEGRPLTRSEAWRNMALVLGHWTLRGFGMWAVEEKSSGALVGRVGCWRPEEWPGLEVGWSLGRAYWGRGYATEAARASLGYAFDVLKADKVLSLIVPENVRSIAVAERLGQSPESRSELFGRPIVVYSIGQRRWKRASRPVTST